MQRVEFADVRRASIYARWMDPVQMMNYQCDQCDLSAEGVHNFAMSDAIEHHARTQHHSMATGRRLTWTQEALFTIEA